MSKLQLYLVEICQIVESKQCFISSLSSLLEAELVNQYFSFVYSH